MNRRATPGVTLRSPGLASVLTSPLCASADALLAPRGYRWATWRASRASHRTIDDHGCMGWAAGLWLASFFPLLLMVIGCVWLIPELSLDPVFQGVTAAILATALAQSGWCLLRHWLSGGRANPTIFDDAIAVGFGFLGSVLL